MNEISIREVLSKQDLKKFVSFPYTLYANSPYWVPLLKSDEIAGFSKDTNPSYTNCEARLWLAYKNDRLVGRVAGIINHAFIEKWKKAYLRFGWIDFVNDKAVLEKLMATIETWALEKGMDAVHGPMGFTDFDPEGMLVDGFAERASMTTIYNYPYYPLYLEKLGYKKDVDWLEYEIQIPEKLPEKIEQLALAVEKRSHLHSLKTSDPKQLLKYAKAIFELLNVTYKDLYGVVTLTEEQIDAYIKQYFPLIQTEYVSVVLDKNDRVAAFAISIPSLSKALQRAKGSLFPFGFYHLYRAFKNNKLVDLYLAAIRPDLQGKGVNALLLRDLTTTFIGSKIAKAITHPALEQNNKVLALWKDFETRQIKRRRCYLKILKKE